MKYLATLFAASLFLNTATASAQTTFSVGVRGGLGRALTTQDAASNYSQSQGTFNTSLSTNKSAIYTWHAGAVAAIGFGKISLQPALLFSQKGETAHTITDTKSNSFYYYNYTEETATSRYNWLELPLNVVYTLHGDHGLQVFGGPYVALALGGRRTGTRYNTSSGVRGPYTDQLDEQLNYGSGTYNRRFDAGINFGVGYRQGPVQLQLGYGLGFYNLHQDASFDNASSAFPDLRAAPAYNRGVQLTGTYFFAL